MIELGEHYMAAAYTVTTTTFQKTYYRRICALGSTEMV